MRRIPVIVLSVAASIVLVATLIGPTATATHQPADKVVASGSKIAVIAPGTDVTLLSATLRTSSPSDLAMQVNLECTILTRLITGGENSETSTATGDVRVWMEFDGVVVPINSVGDGAAGDDSDKITYCNRTYSRTLTDTENDDDGTDTIDDFIRTKSAHSFSWLLLNAGNGIHDIVVKADLTIETAGDAFAEAMVGNRTMIVEPGKLANDAVI